MYGENVLQPAVASFYIILQGNFRDIGDHRVVSREVCSYYIEHMDRYNSFDTSFNTQFDWCIVAIHSAEFLSFPKLYADQSLHTTSSSGVD